MSLPKKPNKFQKVSIGKNSAVEFLPILTKKSGFVLLGRPKWLYPKLNILARLFQKRFYWHRTGVFAGAQAERHFTLGHFPITDH